MPIEEIEQEFPGLETGEWSITSEADDDSLNSWIKAFEMNSYKVCENGEPESGVEKIAIYVDDNNVPQRVARQLPDGAWTSKLGKGEDIQHNSLESLEGDLYGKVAVFMMRRPPRSDSA